MDGALPTQFNYRGSHSTFSVAAFLRALLDIEGPGAVISTACSSGAKAFAAAQRMIEADVIDAALVGGVDSLCLTTLYGFHSLQLMAAGPCRPCAVDRDGISIGEGAAFALLERVDTKMSSQSVALLGVGLGQRVVVAASAVGYMACAILVLSSWRETNGQPGSNPLDNSFGAGGPALCMFLAAAIGLAVMSVADRVDGSSGT